MRFGSPQQEELCPNSKAERLRLRTGQSFLERMGVLYADRIRLNIVAELYMREMSPKQFFEEVGGSSYDSVRRHFLKLVQYGWLRKVRTESSGRGRPEDLYRSTELAVIDDETWAQIPISIRDSFTVQNLLEMGERLETSLTSGAFGSRNENVLSFSTLMLDEAGWVQAIGALNACFRSLAQEQTDAKIRLEKSGSLPILMIVELGGFESSPQADIEPLAALPTAAPAQETPPWPNRISKIFSDPLNLEILTRLNDCPMSPTELHNALNSVSVEGFDRRCKMLVKLGWLVKVDERTGGVRRGATENFYRATSPAVSQAELFSSISREVRSTEAWKVFQQFCQAALCSIRSGTFNRRPDRHLTLCTLLVDEVGWLQLISLLGRCARALTRIGEEATHRLEMNKTSTQLGAGVFVAAFADPNDRRPKR